jgi:hypothetical protein
LLGGHWKKQFARGLARLVASSEDIQENILGVVDSASVSTYTFSTTVRTALFESG